MTTALRPLDLAAIIERHGKDSPQGLAADRELARQIEAKRARKAA